VEETRAMASRVRTERRPRWILPAAWVSATSPPTPAWRQGRAELFALWLVGIAIAFFRLGVASTRGVVWAEDGTIFLQQALTPGSTTSILVPYAGYIDVVPRLLAAGVVALPLNWQGLAINLSAAGVQSAVGVLACVIVGGHLRPRWLRVLLLMCVVAPPVGQETISNVSNLQWFLVFAACLVAYWTPRGWGGWLAAAMVEFLATSSSPFGIVPLAAVTLRAAIQRTRHSISVAVAATLGYGIQAAAMIGAPGRDISPRVDPRGLLVGYINRVLGDGLLGVAHYSLTQPETNISMGLIVFFSLLALVMALIGHRRGATTIVPLALLCLSFITFALPLMISGRSMASPFAASRYYVAPALLFLSATIILIGNSLSISRGAGATDFLAFRVVPLLLVAGLTFGVVTSWQSKPAYGRITGPSWSAGVDAAAVACASLARPASAVVAISPKGWGVTLACARISPPLGH